MKSHKTVYVNPVKRQSVQGRDKQVYSFALSSGQVVQTRSMEKTKEFGVGSEYQFLIDFNSNKLDTGLDEMMVNPFYEYEAATLRNEFSLSAYWSNTRLEEIIAEKQLKKQVYFELLANVEEGFYTSVAGATIFTFKDLKNAPDPTFLQKFKIIIYDGPNKFTTETPRGRLAIQLLSRLPNVAKTKLAVNSAYHDFYISEENEAELEKQMKQDVVNKGIYNLFKLKQECTPYQRYVAATLLIDKDGKSLVKGTVNDESVYTTLNNFVTYPGSNQLKNIQKFLEIVELMEDANGVVTLHIKYLIQQAINSHVISVRDGYYVWHSKKDVPNVYKFTDYKKLFSLLTKEFNIHNPEDEALTNWYGILLAEVKTKDIKIETV